MTTEPMQAGPAEAWVLFAREEKWDALAQALAETGRAEAPDTLWATLGEICLKAQQWALGLTALGRMKAPGVLQKLQINLARNMAAMATHRPAEYEILCGESDDCKYQLVMQGEQEWAVLQHPTTGRSWRLGPAPRVIPGLDHLHSAMRAEQATSTGWAAVLCGMGDGALWRALADYQWKFNGDFISEPALYLIEPDTGVVMHHFMLEDFSGEDGPILKARCRWVLGRNWREQFARIFRDDPGLPFPMITVPQGRLGQEIVKAVNAAGENLKAWTNDLRKSVWQAYESLDVAQLAQLVGPTPPRKPRALLVTSRYTTVLQHSTRDCQEALEALGWETRLAIEATPQHDITGLYLLSEMERFRPDMVFAVDALRCHPPGIFPPQLLHMCWVQDDLPRLTSLQAGQSVGPRDFVLLPAGPLYEKKFGYPARQCLYLEKLTRVPERPARWEQDGDDLVYVSNAGHAPEKVLDDFVDKLRNISSAATIFQETGRRMIALYREGQTLHVTRQVREILDAVCRDVRINITNPMAAENMVLAIFNQLNNVLYRQQALDWVVQLAEKMKLKLALYGAGWDTQERFAPYARGVIAYGQPLEDATRRAKINLQILPFAAVHQRLLDGLAAGGFYLVREHATDRVFRGLIEWTEKQPAEVRDVASMRRLAPAGQRGEIEGLIERYAQLIDIDISDPITRCRELLAQHARHGFAGLPRLSEVSFRHERELEQRLIRFVNDPQAREEIRREQVQFVQEHLTYQGGLRDILARVGEILSSGTAQVPAPWTDGGDACA